MFTSAINEVEGAGVAAGAGAAEGVVEVGVVEGVVGLTDRGAGASATGASGTTGAGLCAVLPVSAGVEMGAAAGVVATGVETVVETVVAPAATVAGALPVVTVPGMLGDAAPVVLTATPNAVVGATVADVTGAAVSAGGVVSGTLGAERVAIDGVTVPALSPVPRTEAPTVAMPVSLATIAAEIPDGITPEKLEGLPLPPPQAVITAVAMKERANDISPAGERCCGIL